MHVDNEIVVLAPTALRDTLEGLRGRVNKPMIVVTTEEELLRLLPPHRNPLVYFFDIECVKHLSPGTVAMLAGRPVSFPPVILLGDDEEAMRRVPFNPNSRLRVHWDQVAEKFPFVVTYWSELNIPLE